MKFKKILGMRCICRI